MTADVELLPLPAIESIVKYVEDYARANVSHAIAAKDAEIEALRAEVDRLEAESQSRLEACGDAVSKLFAAEARAERMAEALRELRANARKVGHDFAAEWINDVLRKEALHHTAAQEAK